MTRIDFRDGVIFLSLFLLVIFIVHILGYLDEQTYISVPVDNSFHEPSTELVIVYTNYNLFLYVFFIFLVFILFLLCKPLDKQLMINQLKCYCPYFLYHQVVCLIPYILRYDNTYNDTIYMSQVYWNRFFLVLSLFRQFIQSYWWYAVDKNKLKNKLKRLITNILEHAVMYRYQVNRNWFSRMDQVNWNIFFLVISSVSQFIHSYWGSMVEKYMLKYKLKRLILYILNPAIYLFMFFLLFILCHNCIELLKREEVSKEFLRVRSFFDHGSLFEDLDVNTESSHRTTFSLDKKVFQQTGQKLYQTTYSGSFQFNDTNGISLPYQRKTYYAGIGESVSLSCHASVYVVGPVSVLWSFNGKYLHSNDSSCNITTNVKKDSLMQEISSQLDIDYIENNGFGNYTCSFQNYDYIGKEVTFKHKKAFPSIKSIQHNIAQYSVKKHSGDEIFIYTTPGGVIDITWKPMVFNNDMEDVIEYYYVNGIPYNRPNEIGLSCTVLSYYFAFYAQASNWLSFSCASKFMQSFNNLNLFEPRLTACAESDVFGVHTVEYFRRIYDKQKKSFVYKEVKHPDTVYVLHDFPYFNKMDNATMEKENKIIRNLHKSRLEYLSYEKSITYIFKVRYIAEMIIVWILVSSFLCFLYLFWISIGYLIQWIRRKLILNEEPIDIADRCTNTLQCYILCGDTDRNFVYTELVKPLRKKNIKTGFIFEESSINKSGKSIFDIRCDILNECKHLVFYITSSYLNEEKFGDIDLTTVLICKQNGFLPENRILLIIGDSSVLPKKVVLNLPNAAMNIQSWVRVTEPDERIYQILEWIKKKKKDSETSDECLMVLRAILG